MGSRGRSIGAGIARTVAVIGDGALTAEWPGRPTIATSKNRRIAIIINDNAALRPHDRRPGHSPGCPASPWATSVPLAWGKHLQQGHFRAAYDALHGLKMSRRFNPRSCSRDLGLKHRGPCHYDIVAVETAEARAFPRPTRPRARSREVTRLHARLRKTSRTASTRSAPSNA